MRQLTLIALVVLVAAVSAQGPVMGSNCSMAMSPSSVNNYYMPPKDCVDTDSVVKICYTVFDLCVVKAPLDCKAVNTCFSGKMRCLEGVTATSANCTTWSTNMNNVQLYLAAGGQYNGSSLESACKFALCGAANEAMKKGLKTQDNMTCPVDWNMICTAPNFAPDVTQAANTTRAPGQAEYALTFDGNWADTINKIENDPALKKLVFAALGKGIAGMLEIEAIYVFVTGIKSGSLVVTFFVDSNAPNFDASTIEAKLKETLANPAATTALFAEFAALPVVVESGNAILVAGVETNPDASGAAQFSAVFAAVLVIAAMMF